MGWTYILLLVVFAGLECGHVVSSDFPPDSLGQSSTKIGGGDNGDSGSIYEMNRSDFTCEYYNPNDCNPETEVCEWNEKCPSKGQGRQQSCYAVWMNTTSEGFKIKLKGCYGNEVGKDCKDRNRCVAVKPETDRKTFFCCCTTPDCNENLYFEPAPGQGNESHVDMVPPLGRNQVLNNIIIALVPVFVAALLIICGYYCYRKYQEKRFYQKNGNCLTLNAGNGCLNGYVNGGVPTNGDLNIIPHGGNVQLLEFVARGRYGVIWKGIFTESNGVTQRDVAVKVFPEIDIESWSQEQEIYNIPALKSHPHILKFYGAEYRAGHVPPLNAENMNGHLPTDPEPRREFWLITQLHPSGSLHDYLKCHTLSVAEVLRLGVGILKGLSFLHEERQDPIYGFKPTVVHRDFKSHNVLIKDDMNACIADFGLALVCEHGQTPTDTHLQVGTRRYMAPEILEGATEFSAFAFRQMDVYAAGLVLWELISRSRVDEEPPQEYRLPYEAEVGAQPSLAAMQEVVLTQKRRPVILAKWADNPALAAVCLTIEEMWESEPEARLTAGCAMERLDSLRDSYPYHPPTAPKTPEKISYDSAVASSATGGEEEGRVVLESEPFLPANVTAASAPSLAATKPPGANSTSSHLARQGPVQA